MSPKLLIEANKVEVFLLIKDTLDEMINWISQNKSKFFGGLFGFLIGIFIVFIGFFKTLFIIICTVIGYVIGSYNINKEDIKGLIERIFSNR
ncbi:MAG: DUF2273 domain-containing protein [Tissierellaceae bacterium]|nr:DUF2273 domain-containing protein [Tissierellaceae bacterium]